MWLFGCSLNDLLSLELDPTFKPHSITPSHSIWLSSGEETGYSRETSSLLHVPPLEFIFCTDINSEVSMVGCEVALGVKIAKTANPIIYRSPHTILHHSQKTIMFKKIKENRMFIKYNLPLHCSLCLTLKVQCIKDIATDWSNLSDL